MIEEKNNGLVTTTQYLDSENAVRVIPPDGNSVTKKFNAHGDVIEMTDNGGTVYYSYHHSWQPDTVKVGNAVFTMEYDQYGRQTHLHDPNAGTIRTAYFSTPGYYTRRNKIEYTIDAKGNRTDYAYDGMNRVVGETSPEGTTVYDFVKTGNARGRIETEMNDAGSGVIYEYDERGRMIATTEKVLGEEQSFKSSYEYDVYGNTVSMSYPGGFKINRIYNAKGYVSEIRNASGNGLIWKREEQNALGQITKYKLGNEKTTTHRFDEYHQPKSIETPGIQSFHYVIDPKNGNLRSREDRLKGLTETFGYDNLNRLDTIRRGATELILSYDPSGNITLKPDVGDYVYGSNDHIHAVTKINNPAAALLNQGGQEIGYNSFQKASYIEEDNGLRLDLIYDHGGERIKMVVSQNNTPQKTKYYASKYEKEIDHATGTTRQVNYIGTPAGTVAAYIQQDGRGEMYYLYKDHLGSITTVVNQSGSRSERRSYDAWGRPRNPDNWSYSNIPAMTLLDRGYTFHEHLPEFGLINMNGRMYDPLVGRMLSPDPYVHDIGGTQGFNRYSYCLNNPLKYTDPSGEHPLLIAAAIGVAISAATYTVSAAVAPGGLQENWNAGGFLKSIGIGALSGMVSFGVGQAFGAVGSMGLVGEFARAGVHAYGQTILGGFAGNQPSWSGFAIGLASSLAGSATSFLPSWTQIGTSALTGGITAELTGGNFWEGAATGATIGLLNHVWHQSTRKPNDYDGFDPMCFENQDAAFEYMWTTSNSAQVELSAWMLADGSVIVLPYHENTINESNNNYLKVTKNTKTGERFVRFQGEKRLIKSHIHTHILEGRQGNPIGISKSDFDFQQKMGFPIYIMHNANIYKYDNNKYYYQKSLY